MNGERPSAPEAGDRWAERWPRLSYRFVLPSIAVVALVLALLLGSDGTSPELAWTAVMLSLLGGGTLLTSVGLYRAHGREAAPFRRPAEGSADSVRQPVRPPVASGSAVSPAPIRYSSNPVPIPSRIQIIRPADLIWEALDAPAVGVLPGSLVGPIGEVPYVPVTALDPMADTLYGGRSPVDLEVDARQRSSENGPMTTVPSIDPSAIPAHVHGEYSVGPHRDYVELEALTPTPPHLRPSPPPRRPHPSLPAPSVDPLADGCATCERRIGQPMAWQRCTVCRDPMCSECLVHSLVEQERAWCRDCTELESIEDSYRALNVPTSTSRSAS